MNRRFVRKGAVLVACVLALAACSGGGGDAGSGDGNGSADGAPTCDDLQVEANGCKTSTQGEKDQFAQVAATCKSQARFTADCRKCLSGKICGVTESCDPLCGK